MGMALTKAPGRGREGPPPTLHGGGGGDPGDGNLPNYQDRLRRARMGLAIALAPVVVLFVAFSVVLVVRRLFATPDAAIAPQVQHWISTPLPWFWLILNTSILSLSSVTIEFARRHLTRQLALAPVMTIPGVSLGKERNVPWLGFTILLGAVFLLGQLKTWSELVRHGILVSSNPGSSFFYILTGMHALHLAGGLMALLYAAYAARRHFAIERQRIIIDIAAWYWHFMATLWIYIVLLLSIAH
jgi:cytochrome c oxidase subunit III